MDPLLASIMLWPVPWAPVGTMFCQGQTLTINSNAVLYSLIGNLFGQDNSASFKLPNFTGRVPVGAGATFNLASTGGSLNPMTVNSTGQFALSTDNLPQHSHTINASTTKISVAIPVNNTNANTATPATNTVLAAGNFPQGLGATVVRNFTTSAANATLLPFDTNVAIPANATNSIGAGTPVRVNVQGTATPSLPPYLAINYIIFTQGIYPERP